MALGKELNDPQIRGPLSGSRMTRDASYHNGLNLLARLIARHMLAGDSKELNKPGAALSNAKLDRTILERESADEQQRDA